MNTSRYKVREVARVAGVSVRTLHYYDEIGLLVPSGRSAAGYRLYDDGDLLRLQQILIGRELGLTLEEIRKSLDDPRFDLAQALRKQRAELEARMERAAGMLRAVDRALAALEQQRGGKEMKPEELFEGLGQAPYADEAKQRWGHTDAYRVSQERTKRYTAEDWQKIHAEQNGVFGELAEAMRAGVKPEDERAMDLAERARLFIDRWFYPCNYAMHQGLADLYESDPRFAANIDKHGDGLTPFVAAAIRANARRHSATDA